MAPSVAGTDFRQKSLTEGFPEASRGWPAWPFQRGTSPNPKPASSARGYWI